MQTRHSRFILWSLLLGVLVVLIVFSFQPKPVLTQINTAQLGELLISVKEEGKTRIHDTYVISTPVTGNLKRINADVGDSVLVSETVIASIEPIDPAFLDPRTEAQVKAEIEAAASSQKLAQARVEQVEAELEFAVSQLKRMQELRISNSVSQTQLDEAARLHKTTKAELATARAALQMRLFEYERAKAQLLSPATVRAQPQECECINITSPINGKVLSVFSRSEGVVQAGTPLVEVGDPQDLEIVVELLSFDAVKVVPGYPVLISNWGGEETLNGTVRRVEPVGFKKVSALGIEEQRVNVIVAFESEYLERERLGHGYQVDVEIVLETKADVLTVPISALFREDNHWALYSVVEDTIEKRIVVIGAMNDYAAEIQSGLTAGEAYIVYPNEQTIVGATVEAL
ncbi:efflux RND transporter periplasmic adaptor subunit [Alteromonas flava]|uniref:efflux RND transporter periplasmic adaptor subunit n=1 Tax=Alteromonas flava TaxID=2048003 RepID=UPI000C28EBC8|nr:HlyD family efflux transporter periplasmic adaptor subunit [Alteromonas flava]